MTKETWIWLKIVLWTVALGVAFNYICDYAEDNRAWYATHPCVKSHVEHQHADPITIVVPLVQPDGSVFLTPQYYPGYDDYVTVCDARAPSRPDPNDTAAAIAGAVAAGQ